MLTAFGLASKIERPPFPGRVDLVLTEATSLHPSPDDSTAPRAELEAGDTVTVLDEAAHNASAWPQVKEGTDFSVYEVPWWVYVSAPTGAQGWVRTDALAWP